MSTKQQEQQEKGESSQEPQFLSKEQLESYERNGFLVLEGFFTQDDCNQMRAACQRWVEKYDPAKEKLSTFSTTDQVWP